MVSDNQWISRILVTYLPPLYLGIFENSAWDHRVNTDVSMAVDLVVSVNLIDVEIYNI
jgi:hypothetical protein